MKYTFYREDRVALPIFIGEKMAKHIFKLQFRQRQYRHRVAGLAAW